MNIYKTTADHFDSTAVLLPIGSNLKYPIYCRSTADFLFVFNGSRIGSRIAKIGSRKKSAVEKTAAHLVYICTTDSVVYTRYTV